MSGGEWKPKNGDWWRREGKEREKEGKKKEKECGAEFVSFFGGANHFSTLLQYTAYSTLI